MGKKFKGMYMQKCGLRDGSLVPVTALLAQGLTDSSLKYHLQNAKNHGVTQKRGYFLSVHQMMGVHRIFPAEVKHWHGAVPDECFSHLAVNDSNSANQIAHRTHHASW